MENKDYICPKNSEEKIMWDRMREWERYLYNRRKFYSPDSEEQLLFHMDHKERLTLTAKIVMDEGIKISHRLMAAIMIDAGRLPDAEQFCRIGVIDD